VLAGREVNLTVRGDQEVETVNGLPDSVEGPLERGARLGALRVLVDGRLAARVPLEAAQAVPAPSALDRIDEALPGGRAAVWATGAALLALIVAAVVAFAGRHRGSR
jgi:D-alanyl-D-alanine carboxypeptidase (penicillin-binding protein 5/6)